MVNHAGGVNLFFYKNYLGYLNRYIYIYIYKINVSLRGSYLFFKIKYVVKELLYRRILKFLLNLNIYIYVVVNSIKGEK